MTKDREIIEFISATYVGQTIMVFGKRLLRKADFYNYPLKSSLLDIYKSDGKQDAPELYDIACIKYKLFSMVIENGHLVFFPILHSA